MIGVRVGDHGPFDWPPWIDEDVGAGAVQALRRGLEKRRGRQWTRVGVRGFGAAGTSGEGGGPNPLKSVILDVLPGGYPRRAGQFRP